MRPLGSPSSLGAWTLRIIASTSRIGPPSSPSLPWVISPRSMSEARPFRSPWFVPSLVLKLPSDELELSVSLSVCLCAPSSQAILRYAGKLAKLYPENPIEALYVDSLLDSMEELGSTILRTMPLPEAEGLAERA